MVLQLSSLKKTLIGTGKKTCVENYGVASLVTVNFYLVSDILIEWRLLSNTFLVLRDFIPCSPNLRMFSFNTYKAKSFPTGAAKHVKIFI